MSDESRRDDVNTTSRTGGAAAVDARTEAERVAAGVVRREGRRVRTLAVAAISLWVVAFFLIAGVFLPAAAKAKQAAQVLTQPSATGQPLTAQQLADTIAPLLVGTLAVAGVMMAMALLTAMLASACTVALALTIRRVTLRQVTESLAEISAQLRQQQSQRQGT
jgi:ABC-type phosphate transport system permease subunit